MSDVAQKVNASSILHGIDIENHLFPSTPAHNVLFSVNSITALPLGWTDRFDLVHQRLLLGALSTQDWINALRNIYQALRHGGWVQLLESGLWQAGESVRTISDLVEKLLVSRSMRFDIAVALPSLLHDAGFTNITVEKRDIRVGKWAGQTGADARDNIMMLFRALKTPILRSGGFGVVSSEGDFDDLLDSVKKEWDNHIGAQWTVHMFCAQKPVPDTSHS